MKLLLLADEPNPRLWDHLDRRLLEGVNLVLSCGDLPASYLSFLTCFTDAPILYVHGNHDTRYDLYPPEGCICIEDQVYVHEGLRILGLGGSMRYKPGAHQYTEKEMARRMNRLSFRLRRMTFCSRMRRWRAWATAWICRTADLRRSSARWTNTIPRITFTATCTRNTISASAASGSMAKRP